MLGSASMLVSAHAQPQFPSIFHPWPKHHSSTVHYASFPQMVTRWPHSTLWPHAPWWPEVNHSGRLITHHQFPFIPYPFSVTCPCFNIPDPHHPCLSDPRSHDFSGLDYYSSIVSVRATLKCHGGYTVTPYITFFLICQVHLLSQTQFSCSLKWLCYRPSA